MNKLIVLSISVIIVASCLMAMNTSAAGTFKDSIESDAYIKKIEKLNNNRILSPELTEILPDVIYNDNINYGEIVNVWKSRDSVTGASDFIFECSHSDSFEIMIDPSKVETGVEIDEILGYIKNKIAYSENVEIKGERTNGYFNVNGKFKTDNHDLIIDTNRQLKSTLLFNIFSYMCSQLLGKGNTVAAIDELYLFLSNMTAIEYIRNAMKRVRKRESALLLASQNIEDFLVDEVKEYTKPLFSIPTHSFFFNVGNCSAAEFIDTVQLLKTEYALIDHSERGTCLYRCGNERYLLQVHAPAYKEALFGKAGGR